MGRVGLGILVTKSENFDVCFDVIPKVRGNVHAKTSRE